MNSATRSAREDTSPKRCAAGIVFAVPIEADAFARLATDAVELQAGGLTFHEGTVAARRIAWCVAGVGGDAAAQAARLLVAGHRPRLLVSAGFAGGLAPTLPRGSVIRAAQVIRPEGTAARPLAHAVSVEGRPLSLVTTDRIITTPIEKEGLRAACAADAVDMETFAVAEAAAAADLPCASVRVISDDARQALPREVAALARPQSSMRRLGAALAVIGRRPRAALDLWGLYENAVIDGRTLAAALADLCGSLPARD